MALNRTSKFGADEGLFVTREEIEPVIPIEETKPKNPSQVKTYKKEAEESKPKKKLIRTKSRTYTIDNELYSQMGACVQILRDNNVKNEENNSLITESAFIRKAIRAEINRLIEMNGPEFEQQIQALLHTPVNKNPKIKY